MAKGCVFIEREQQIFMNKISFILAMQSLFSKPLLSSLRLFALLIISEEPDFAFVLGIFFSISHNLIYPTALQIVSYSEVTDAKLVAMRQSIGHVNLAGCAIARRLQVPAVATTGLDSRERRIAAVGSGRADIGSGKDCGEGGGHEKGGGGNDIEIHDVWFRVCYETTSRLEDEKSGSVTRHLP
jgi:hypothetical protein